MSRPPNGVGINLTLVRPRGPWLPPRAAAALCSGVAADASLPPLPQDLQPLKDQKVAVRVLQDYGTAWTRDGEVALVKGKRLFLWRDDVQQLVQEGAHGGARGLRPWDSAQGWRGAAALNVLTPRLSSLWRRRAGADHMSF